MLAASSSCYSSTTGRAEGLSKAKVHPAVQMTVKRDCGHGCTEIKQCHSMICKKGPYLRKMPSSHPFGWSGCGRSRWWQLLFFPQSRGVGEKRPARDVKSDTDSKLALLCEASCSGLILSESMCGGLELWHTSGDSTEYPPSAVAAAAAASVSRHQSGLEDKRNNKARAAIMKNILTSETSHHTDTWQECIYTKKTSFFQSLKKQE